MRYITKKIKIKTFESMLNNIWQSGLDKGLCFHLIKIGREELGVDEDEQWEFYKRLDKWFDSELPERRPDRYCWNKYELQPRVEWLENKLKELKDGGVHR